MTGVEMLVNLCLTWSFISYRWIMKALFLFICLTAFSLSCPAQQSFALAAPLPAKNLAMFGRGLYPGDEATYQLLKQSGFGTVLLSSFYIHVDGDLYSGDSHQPIIHKGKWVWILLM